jgi:predicted metal-dependent hydrolase
MGALPKGCTIDDVIRFPDEAAQWLGQTVDWVQKRKRTLPGVIIESQKSVLFHPRTYLTKRLKLPMSQ